MRYPAANHGSDKDTSQALPASKHKTLSSPIFLRMCSCEKKWGGVPLLFSLPCNSTASLVQISGPSASPRYPYSALSIPESPACSSFEGQPTFQTVQRGRIVLPFSRCSRTKIGSAILSPSFTLTPSRGNSYGDQTAHLHRAI